jgi:hypothetical protein
VASNGGGPLDDDVSVSRSFQKTYLALHICDRGTARAYYTDASGEETRQRTAEQNGIATRDALIFATGSISERGRRNVGTNQRTAA